MVILSEILAFIALLVFIWSMFVGSPDNIYVVLIACFVMLGAIQVQLSRKK